MKYICRHSLLAHEIGTKAKKTLGEAPYRKNGKKCDIVSLRRGPWGCVVNRSSLFSPNLPGAEIAQKLIPDRFSQGASPYYLYIISIIGMPKKDIVLKQSWDKWNI